MPRAKIVTPKKEVASSPKGYRGGPRFKKQDSTRKLILLLPETYFTEVGQNSISEDQIKNLVETYVGLHKRETVPASVMNELSAMCFPVSEELFKYIVTEYQINEGFVKAESRLHKAKEKGTTIFTMTMASFKKLGEEYVGKLDSLRIELIRELECVSKERNFITDSLEHILV